MKELPSQEGDRVGAGYPHVERVKVTATPGRGWFRDSTFVIYGGGFSWHFSRPLKKDGGHGRLRRTRKVQRTKQIFMIPYAAGILYWPQRTIKIIVWD